MRKTKRMRIVEFWEKSSEDCYFLKRSTKPGAQGAICISRKDKVIALKTYATFLSPIHNLTAFPGRKILDEKKSWQEKGKSNGVLLNANTNCFLGCYSPKWLYDLSRDVYYVVTHYKIPKNYSGPHYKERRIVQDAKTLEIYEVKMEYEDGRTDIGKFTYTEEGFKIRWQCEYGPNKHNISFF